MKTERTIKESFKGLGRNKTRTFLMMLGIIIGIATLTIIVSAILGAKSDVMGKVAKFGLDQISISAGAGKILGVPQDAPVITLKLEDAEAILSEVKNIKAMAPSINTRAMPIKSANGNTEATVIATTPEWSTVWDTTAAAGEFINEEDLSTMARVAVIGQTVAKELFGSEDPVGKQIRIRELPFTVKGVLQAKGTSPSGQDMDSRTVIPLTTGQKRLLNKDHIGTIKVLLRNPSKMGETTEEIRHLLRERHNLQAGVPDDFTFITPTQVTEVATQVSTALSLFLIVISGISLIVGGIVVGNIMLISVGERKQEIGLRRALGARKRDILTQFLFESVAVTVLGGFVGVIIGLAGGKLLSLFTKLSVVVSWEPFLLAFLFSGIVGVLAGISPARRAASLDPVEALRS
jgi:putative ABC transport system permease protein